MRRNRSLTLVAMIFLSLIIYSATKINYWYVLNYIIYRPMVTVEEISFSGTNKKLYLKTYQKGLNHEVKVISPSASKFSDPNRNRDFILETQLDIFYEKSADTLKLYLLKSFQVPKTRPSGLIIEQFELDNPSYMNLYDQSRQSSSRIRFF